MSPIIRELKKLCDESGRTRPDIEARAGVGENTIHRWWGKPDSRWSNPTGPSITLIEAVLGALGYRLTIERME
jgi:hypothetical protein